MPRAWRFPTYHRPSFSWLLLSMLLAAAPLVAQPEPPPSAWDNLTQGNPNRGPRVSTLEREVLQLMTMAQLEEYMSGTSPEAIVLGNGETLSALLSRKGAGVFKIPWASIDAGGGTASVGGCLILSGTVGQPDSGAMSGGQFTLTGGFWATGPGTSTIFSDGFEAGTPACWTNTIG